MASQHGVNKVYLGCEYPNRTGENSRHRHLPYVVLIVSLTGAEVWVKSTFMLDLQTFQISYPSSQLDYL